MAQLKTFWNSPEYKAIADWIAAGAPGPKADDPRIVSLSVSEPHLVTQAGKSLQLKVTAKFSDGHSEDVTRWCKYNATNASVATVDDSGLIKTTGSGEATVSAWYLSLLSVTTVTVPQPGKLDDAAFAVLQPRNFIDEHVLTKLRELNIPPSDRASDAEFIRRAFLDTIGVLPTAEEAQAFLADKAADKRDRVIDALLKRPEFVDYWSHRWSDLFLVNGDKLMPQAMWSYYNWIRRHVAANTPWDAMVRDLLTASGSTLEHGGGNFFVLNDEPTKCAETVSVAFMGTSIACAKCHNHPMEKWTHDQYYAFANLFARIRSKNGTQANERVLFSDTQGEIITPLTGKPQPPRPLVCQSRADLWRADPVGDHLPVPDLLDHHHQLQDGPQRDEGEPDPLGRLQPRLAGLAVAWPVARHDRHRLDAARRVHEAVHELGHRLAHRLGPRRGAGRRRPYRGDAGRGAARAQYARFAGRLQRHGRRPVLRTVQRRHRRRRDHPDPRAAGSSTPRARAGRAARGGLRVVVEGLAWDDAQWTWRPAPVIAVSGTR